MHIAGATQWCGTVELPHGTACDHGGGDTKERTETIRYLRFERHPDLRRTEVLVAESHLVLNGIETIGRDETLSGLERPAARGDRPGDEWRGSQGSSIRCPLDALDLHIPTRHVHRDRRGGEQDGDDQRHIHQDRAGFVRPTRLDVILDMAPRPPCSLLTPREPAGSRRRGLVLLVKHGAGLDFITVCALTVEVGAPRTPNNHVCVACKYTPTDSASGSPKHELMPSGSHASVRGW